MELLSLIRDARSLRIKDVRDLLKIPHDSINALMQYLKRKALVRKSGDELNAPYVLTDVIHLISDVRQVQSEAVITLVILPLYAVFFFVGVEAYVLAVSELSDWLRRRGVDRARRLSIRLGIHLLCAFGVCLGRVERLNSWDTVVHPMRLANASWNTVTHPARMLVTFVVIVVVFNTMKALTLAVRTWWTAVRTGTGGLAGA